MKKKNFLFVLLLLVCACLIGCTPVEDDPDEGDEPGDGMDDPLETYGLHILAPSEGSLKIAQFADIHFGVEGKDWHNDKVQRTLDYMDYIVETTKPNLIVCSGDNILSTGVAGLSDFVDKMDSYQTPWTFIYGNHDAEGFQAGYSKQDLSNYLDNVESEYLIYESGYVEKGSANRYGNFTISVLDSEGKNLLGGIILMDAGTYDSSTSSYQAITSGQIDWYKSEIDRLQAHYPNGTVPTIVFSHIQLPEFKTACEKALANNGAEFVIEEELTEADIASVAEGGPSVNTGFYDALVEKGSTKAYFVGHAHTRSFQVKMDGIVLGFAPQIGFAKCFDDNDLARNCYIYNLNNDFTFTTTTCPEQAENLGLAYSGSYDGVAKANADGNYVVEADFKLWSRLLFSYNGVRITPENTTVTGYFENTANATWSEYLYTSTGENFIYSSSQERTYIFTYNPTENTLNIDIKIVEVETNYNEINVNKVNVDAGGDAIAVWTTAGTKVKKVTDSSTGAYEWLGSAQGWRYYIVVDAEGKICYAVSMPPNGYGGPTGNGYYCHSSYSDYNNNPIFTFLEGFGPWVQGGFVHNLFEITIPEGGFAITAHGSGIGEIVAALSNGTITDLSEASINKKGVFSDDLRLEFDAKTNKIIITR